MVGSIVMAMTTEVGGFARGGTGIFSFDDIYASWKQTSGHLYARGVAVCGAGLLYR